MADKQIDWKTWIELILLLSSVTISIVALVQANQAVKSSDWQFAYLNQGYISIEPQTVFVSDNIDDPRPVYQSLEFAADIQNVGNFPILYGVTRCDVYSQGILVDSLLPKAGKQSPLYPKESTRHTMARIHFKNPKEKSEAGELKYQCHITIEYSDLGSRDKKYIDRIINFEFFGIDMTYVYDSIADRLLIPSVKH
jgi:hypothetical protein